MEWPWPERKATPAVLTWGGCHRRPPGGRRWPSSTFRFVARCIFPWSAPSAETRLIRLRGLRSETGLGASDRGRADGVAPTRVRSSRRNDTVDVDRRRTRDRAPGKGRLRQTCHPVLSTSATSVWRAKRVLHVKPEKARASFATAAAAHRSCGALLELLVCATASYETHYCPCETPVQNEAAMPFLEQDKPPGC